MRIPFNVVQKFVSCLPFKSAQDMKYSDFEKALSSVLPHLQRGYAVKKLEWVNSANQDGFLVSTATPRLLSLQYIIFNDPDPDVVEFTVKVFLDETLVRKLSGFDELGEAKAAAQADFERRVGECIEDSQQELEDTCNVTDLCCPHCGGSGHIDDVVTKPVDVEVRASANNTEGVISEYAGAAFKQQGNGVPEHIWYAHFREFASAILALSAEPAQAGEMSHSLAGFEVKKLEWDEGSPGLAVRRFYTTNGMYSVAENSDGVFIAMKDNSSRVVGSSDSLEGIKNLVQEYHERRVRDCIVRAHHGWLYHNEDAGTEYSKEHPITSGNCPDALDVRPATADNLLDELISSLKLLDEYQQELMSLRDDFNDRDIDWDDALNSAALIVEGRSTAANSELVKSLIGKTKNEIAEIIAEHDAKLGSEIRALSAAPTTEAGK